MPRRVYVPFLYPADILLAASQAHHLRDVLRIQTGEIVEVFDDFGKIARGTIVRADADGVCVRVERVEKPSTKTELVIASAVPKGDRADWMIEKLSELGVTRFIPLQTERSVVHPTGISKRDRWMRIATESAKQSHRIGVMQIEELTPLVSVPLENSIYCTVEEAISLADLKVSKFASLRILIGPEGGWSEQELALFKSRSLTGVKLTATILRVETAAVAAAAIAANRLLGA